MSRLTGFRRSRRGAGLIHVKHERFAPISQHTAAQRSLPARLRRRSARQCDPLPKPRVEDPRRSIPAPLPPAQAPKPALGARPENRAGAFQASTKPAHAKTCALRPDRQWRQAAGRPPPRFLPIWQGLAASAAGASASLRSILVRTAKVGDSSARRRAGSAVAQPQRQVRALGFAARSRDAFLFDRITGCRECPPCRRE